MIVVVAFIFFRALNNIRVTFLSMRESVLIVISYILILLTEFHMEYIVCIGHCEQKDAYNLSEVIFSQINARFFRHVLIINANHATVSVVYMNVTF